jgi:heme/copper-type cytochrome/quinol oxidase subunit 1
MAITETRPEPATHADDHVNPWDTGEPTPGFAKLIGSSDHKTIGRFYIVFALLFGVKACVLAGLVALDAVPDIDLLPDDTVGQVFTLSRLSLVLLFAVPLFVGVATYVVPLQVGASTIAFPRAAAAAFWVWLLGAVMLIVSYVSNGGVAGGEANAVDLSYLAMGVVVVALMLAAVCIVTTVVALRAPGMRLDRVPMFSWGMFVAASIWLLTLPVFVANILLIYLDVRFGQPSDFGVASNQWPQLAWLFQQPQLFAFAIPVLGALGDVVVTSAGVRQRNRGFLVGAIAAFGVFSFGAFAQEFFNEDVWEQVLYVAVGLVIVIPTLMLVAGWVTTMMGGKPAVTAASLATLFASLVLLLSVTASALYVIKPLRLHDSPAFQDGLLALVIGLVVLGGIASLYFWGPKMWGHLGNEGLGKLLGLAAFAGAVLAGLPQCVLGFANRWDGLADAADALNVIAALGYAVVAIAVLVAVIDIFSMTRGADAGNDPWGGQTLEWSTTSPPPTGNFAELPTVASAEPLLDLADSDTDADKEVAS